MEPPPTAGLAAPACVPQIDDLACPSCGERMAPEHAHHKCPRCGYIEPCCGW